MSATVEQPFRRAKVLLDPPPLASGDHLAAAEFLRRFKAMEEVKKAELVNGVVIMASPVRIDQHGEPDSMAQGFLFNYSVATPYTRSATNTTVRLGPDDVPQPDVLLRVLPDAGGRSRIDSKGYLSGPPELIFEIAASSASIDTREKRDAYRRAGVQEYIVWRTDDAEIDWWQLNEDEYVRLAPDEAGIIRSAVFPGLWLNVEGMLMENASLVIACLNQGLASIEHLHFIEKLKAANQVAV